MRFMLLQSHGATESHCPPGWLVRVIAEGVGLVTEALRAGPMASTS